MPRWSSAAARRMSLVNLRSIVNARDLSGLATQQLLPWKRRNGHRGAKRNAASEAFRRLFRVLALIIVSATLGIVRVADSRKRRVGTRCR